ncbi:MAG: lysylphosphatidylglycerol synthase transmembrane domain-containing protein [Candidatus Daviesbacteria bacterium]|nr:lysylphosphatidylglycerol synthase transmembrane domain-containing protein [Candidatus Daviesbacteria bacterium]
MLNKSLITKIVINSLLGLIFIFIWTRFVNLNDVLQILKTADLKLASVFFLTFALAGILRGFRLKLLLHKHQIPIKDAVMIHYLAQFLSFMIPIRAGELTKSVYLTSQFNLPLGKTVTWVFIDRALDLLMVLIFIAVLLPFIPTNLPADFIKLILLVLLIFIGMFVLAITNEKLFKKMTIFLSKFLVVSSIKRKFVTLTHTIIEGFDVLKRSPKELIKLAVLTFFALIFDSLSWMIAFMIVGAKLDLSKFILADSLVAFSFLVPAAPGYVGSAEAAGLAVFSGILKMNPNLSSAGTLMFHILTVVILLVLGLLSLYFLKFDLGLVWKKIKGDSHK